MTRLRFLRTVSLAELPQLINILGARCRWWARARDKASRRVAPDLHYIDHWSLGLDLKILLKTIIVMLGLRTPTELFGFLGAP